MRGEEKKKMDSIWAVFLHAAVLSYRTGASPRQQLSDTKIRASVRV